MMKYIYQNREIDSVELKCLVVSHGLTIDKAVYQRFSPTRRLNANALTCNCFKLPDETIVMATDMGFHLSTLSSMFSWDNLKLFRYLSDMKTDFRIRLVDETPVLCSGEEVICPVTFLPHTDFYKQKTASGMPHIGNAVLQGCDWVAFQCLWPCEYAQAGKPCQYCFSGGQFESLAKRGKPMPFIPSPEDVSEVVNYAIDHCSTNSVQITGGSTFDANKEAAHITRYLSALPRKRLNGEVLLYITPPESHEIIDRYFSLGADRIACSLEVWDDERAAVITPGKRLFTTKQRHLNALSYIAEKYGPNRAFSNFIIGLESIETLKQGAAFLAERGIIPSASVWMPFGKPVMNSMTPPDLDYFRAVKEMLAELYVKYNLTPAGGCGLNVCVERDIWRYATQS